MQERNPGSVVVLSSSALGGMSTHIYKIAQPTEPNASLSDPDLPERLQPSFRTRSLCRNGRTARRGLRGGSTARRRNRLRAPCTARRATAANTTRAQSLRAGRVTLRTTGPIVGRIPPTRSIDRCGAGAAVVVDRSRNPDLDPGEEAI
jgi:hypothetical protein